MNEQKEAPGLEGPGAGESNAPLEEQGNDIAISTESQTLKAALDYAARGLPVFPCDPRGKRPLTANGFKAATRDEAQIRAWWQRQPDAMIGLPTGHASGVFVLDIDAKPGGPDGYASLRSCLQKSINW